MKTPKKFGRKHIEPTICKLPKTELNVCKKSRTDTGNTTKSVGQTQFMSRSTHKEE